MLLIPIGGKPERTVIYGGKIKEFNKENDTTCSYLGSSGSRHLCLFSLFIWVFRQGGD